MIAEHEAKLINEFKGVFDRGQDEAVPLNHSIEAFNVSFDTREIRSRFGSALDLTITGPLLRVHTYEKSGEATRYLCLKDNGSIYDSTAPTVAILTIPAMTDFSCVVMFDRAYISPHNGDRGLPGELVYVYEGAGLARPAGGAGPTVAPIVANSTADGSVEIGTHLFAIAFETTSGFLTKYGPVANLTAIGGKKATLTGIPIGPAGTIARWIVATETILNYNGNPAQYEFFMVPGGRVGDNTTTTATVDFYDASLVASAAYLLDLRATCPAGVGLAIYKNSLVVCGEDASPSRVRVSQVNQPEAFSDVDGYLDCYPKDNGGTTRACVEFRSQLIMFKSYRCYVTQTNNDVAATWNVSSLDVAVGTECFGIQQVLDIEGQTTDKFVVASRQGLMLYNGTFGDELSGKIADIWKRINRQVFNKITVSLNPIESKLYVMVPLDGATQASHILFADYVEGMNSADIKWAVWRFPVDLVASFVDIVYANKQATYKYAGALGNIYKADPSTPNDFNNPKIAYFETSLITHDPKGGMCMFSGIRLRVSGHGNLQITAYALDKTLVITAPSLLLSGSPGQLIKREFLGAQNEFMSFRFQVDQIDESFSVRGIWVYGMAMWAERPEF